MVVLPWQTLSLQYWRRYKWLIKEEFDNLIPLDPNPDFEPFQNVLDDLAQVCTYPLLSSLDAT